MKISPLCCTTVAVSTVFFLIGLKWLFGASQLTALDTIEALTILTLLPIVQVRILQTQRRDFRDAQGNRREDWKQDVCMIALGFQLMLGFGLWLASDLLRRK
jgi:hypothetical protein